MLNSQDSQDSVSIIVTIKLCGAGNFLVHRTAGLHGLSDFGQ
jgi:hypothetical protein